MNTTRDPVAQWTRQLEAIRARVLKHGRGSQSAGDELTHAALAACEGLLRDLAGARMECERLQTDVRTSNAGWEHLFEVMPVACLLTDAIGSIINANRAAGALLSVTAKHLKGRQLLVFSENREAFATILARLAGGSAEEVQARLTFRPRERRPSEVDVVIAPLSGESSGIWLWYLTPAQASHHLSEPGSSAGARLSA